MLVTIHLLQTWGDHHYVGLNGLEMYDQTGKSLFTKAFSIFAYPIVRKWRLMVCSWVRRTQGCLGT